MVATTRLLEVTTTTTQKVGSEWVQPAAPSVVGEIQNSAPPPPPPTSPTSYWNYATTSLQDMASSTIGGMVSSLYGGGGIRTPAVYHMASHNVSSSFHPDISQQQQQQPPPLPLPETTYPLTQQEQEPPANSFWSWWYWNTNPSSKGTAWMVNPMDGYHHHHHHHYYNDDVTQGGGTDYDEEEDEDIMFPKKYTTPRSSGDTSGQQQQHHRRRSSILAFSNNNNSSSSSPWQGNHSKHATPHSDLVWMFRNNKNPYNAVRGRETQLSSLTAVRSLVALVATTTTTTTRRRMMMVEPPPNQQLVLPSQYIGGGGIDTATESCTQTATTCTVPNKETNPPYNIPESTSSSVPPPPYDMLHDDSLVSRSGETHTARTTALSASTNVRMTTTMTTERGVSTPSETASQLAEGTIRALRDLALEEAVELQAALRYWNYRWERPLLSWLEAGPLGTCVVTKIISMLVVACSSNLRN
jgi:hypothetical protein